MCKSVRRIKTLNVKFPESLVQEGKSLSRERSAGIYEQDILLSSEILQIRF